MTKMCTSTGWNLKSLVNCKKCTFKGKTMWKPNELAMGKTLKNLTASPGDPLSSAPASVADSTPKPDAEQEVQASDMEISIIISLSLELGCLRNLWMLMMPHNLLFDRNRLF